MYKLCDFKLCDFRRKLWSGLSKLLYVEGAIWTKAIMPKDWVVFWGVLQTGEGLSGRGKGISKGREGLKPGSLCLERIDEWGSLEIEIHVWNSCIYASKQVLRPLITIIRKNRRNVWTLQSFERES